MKNKLREYQRKAVKFDTPYVVLRWGRETGKEVVIEAIREENDITIAPATMARELAAKFEGRITIQEQLVTDKLLTYIQEKPKRIFLDECAFYTSDLLKMINLLEQTWPEAQIWLVSTPKGGWKIDAAGFQFDMLCARLERTPVHDYSYMRWANLEGFNKHKKKLGESLARQEFLAGWIEIL